MENFTRALGGGGSMKMIGEILAVGLMVLSWLALLVMGGL